MGDSTPTTFNTVIGVSVKSAPTDTNLENRLKNLLKLDIPVEFSSVLNANIDLSDLEIKLSEHPSHDESVAMQNWSAFKTGAENFKQKSERIKTDIQNTKAIIFSDEEREMHVKWVESMATMATMTSDHIEQLESMLVEWQADHKLLQEQFSKAIEPLDTKIKLFKKVAIAVKSLADVANAIHSDQSDRRNAKFGELNVELLNIKKQQNAIVTQLLQVMREVDSFKNKRFGWVMLVMNLNKPHHDMKSKQHTVGEVVNEFERQAALLVGGSPWSLKYLLDDIYTLQIAPMQREIFQGNWLKVSINFKPIVLNDIQHSPVAPAHKQTHEFIQAKKEAQNIALKATSLNVDIGNIERKYYNLGLLSLLHFKATSAETCTNQHLTLDRLKLVESELPGMRFDSLMKKPDFYRELNSLVLQIEQYARTEANVLSYVKQIGDQTLDAQKLNNLIGKLKTWNTEQNAISNTINNMDGILSKFEYIQQGLASVLYAQMYDCPDHSCMIAKPDYMNSIVGFFQNAYEKFGF